MELIDLSNNYIEILKKIEKGHAAFPLIDYSQEVSLNLPSTTIKAAYTNISNTLGEHYLDHIEWNSNGNIEWQNKMLVILEDEIMGLINQYFEDESQDLLIRIFLTIQLWGGNGSRGFFVRNGGFDNNFNSDIYTTAIKLIKEGDYNSANTSLIEMSFIGTSFATKHIRFWSNLSAPIYDSIIAKIVFGEKVAYPKDYLKYLDVLNDLSSQIDVTPQKIERNLFNWGATPDGLKWQEIRIRK